MNFSKEAKMKQDELEEAIYKAIESNNIKDLRQRIYDLENFLRSANPLPDLSLEFLNQLLNSERFLKLGGALYLIILFQKLWEELSEEKVNKCLPILRLAHYNFDDLDFPFIEQLISSALDEDSVSLTECAKAIDLKTATRGESYFPDDYFSAILKLFESQIFLNNDGAWEFLALLQDKWKFLSVSQKEILLFYLEKYYDKFQDWMAYFAISELLGEYYANEQAFEVLCRLKATESEIARAFIPHGLEHFIKRSGSKSLSQKAYIFLLKMRGDPSDLVRDEVEESLRKLSDYLFDLDRDSPA